MFPSSVSSATRSAEDARRLATAICQISSAPPTASRYTRTRASRSSAGRPRRAAAGSRNHHSSASPPTASVPAKATGASRRRAWYTPAGIVRCLPPAARPVSRDAVWPYFSCQLGRRFSAKARGPSLLSSVVRMWS